MEHHPGALDGHGRLVGPPVGRHTVQLLEEQPHIVKARAGGEELVSSSSHTTAVAGRLSSKTTVPVAASGSLDCPTAPDAEHGLVGLREATAPPGEHRRSDGTSTSMSAQSAAHASSATQQCHPSQAGSDGGRHGAERRAARRQQEAEGHRQEAKPSEKPVANRRPKGRGQQLDA